MSTHTVPSFVSTTDVIRNQILGALLETTDYVSGETLCAVAGVTRTAIWKHIRSLEDMGFVIDRKHGVGYRIVHTPDILLEPLVKKRLDNAVVLGQTVIWKPTTESTNADAAALAKDGADHGTVVTALVQQGGRGRRGKPWSSPEGGLWQSIVIRREIPLHRAAELTLVASIAVRRALMHLTELPITIKWPNDLLCEGKKICGILAEIQSEGESLSHAVLGIGINTNVASSQVPDLLKATATSVLMETGEAISHLELECRLLYELNRLIMLLVDGGPGFAAVSDEWRQASSTLGKPVKISANGQLVEGEAVDIDDHGVLLLKTPTGLQRILSGDVLF